MCLLSSALLATQLTEGQLSLAGSSSHGLAEWSYTVLDDTGMSPRAQGAPVLLQQNCPKEAALRDVLFHRGGVLCAGERGASLGC